MDYDKSAIGIITSRKCPTCGHHEVGFTDGEGIFNPLKEGDIVQIVNRSSFESKYKSGDDQISECSVDDQKGLSDREIWVPDPFRGDRLLRCKYGVFYDKKFKKEEISPDLYEVAFKQKLQSLIENEQFAPLPVILDRFFVAPNLATGSPEQVAQALWDELEEIRKPVEYVSQWIECRDMDSLARMIHPRSFEEISNHAISDEEMKKELAGISLEDFLELLQGS